MEDVSGRPSSGRATPFGTATYLVYPPTHRFIAWLAQGVPPLYALFRSGWPDWLTGLALPLAILWSAAIYAAAQAATGSPTLTVLALGCGLYWPALRVRSGSLIPSLICHVLWDFTVLWVRPLS